MLRKLLLLLIFFSNIRIHGVEKPHGLKSPEKKTWGNICFINAVIQCMYAMDRFTNTLLQNPLPYKAGSVAQIYSTLVKELKETPSGKQADPVPLCVRAWETLHARPGTQQSALQILQLLLNSVTNNDVDISRLPSPEYYRDLPLRLNTPLSRLVTIIEEQSALTTQDIVLETKYVSFNNLYLPVFPTTRTLQDCLKNYFMGTPRSLYIWQGKRFQDVRRSKRLQYLPDYLIISLSLEDWKDPQIMRPYYVSFPLDELSFSEFLASGTSQTLFKNTQYTLRACIVRIGQGMTFGHFIAWVKRDSTWYHCNDAIIRGYTSKYFQGIAAQGYDDTPPLDRGLPYILFYERASISETFEEHDLRVRKAFEEHDLRVQLQQLQTALTSLNSYLKK